uniref:Rib_recp_KP_reg domain-containing protein n=1 Tax=Steinernema glaseri TaxID=37863 RepID=A0A1I7Z3J0_9BILA
MPLELLRTTPQLQSAKMSPETIGLAVVFVLAIIMALLFKFMNTEESFDKVYAPETKAFFNSSGQKKKGKAAKNNAKKENGNTVEAKKPEPKKEEIKKEEVKKVETKKPEPKKEEAKKEEVKEVKKESPKPKASNKKEAPTHKVAAKAPEPVKEAKKEEVEEEFISVSTVQLQQSAPVKEAAPVSPNAIVENVAPVKATPKTNDDDAKTIAKLQSDLARLTAEKSASQSELIHQEHPGERALRELFTRHRT